MGGEFPLIGHVPWWTSREQLDHISLQVPDQDLKLARVVVRHFRELVVGAVLGLLGDVGWRLGRVICVQWLCTASRTILLVVFLSADQAIALWDVADRGRIIVFVTSQLSKELEAVRHHILILLLLLLLEFSGKICFFLLRLLRQVF